MAAPPPPPRTGDEERQDLEEGTGESASPLPGFWGRQEVQRRVHERLRRTAGWQDDDQRRLAGHLQRMPPRYLVDVDVDDKAEDVLLHWRILDECADPDKRPVFHARYIRSITFGGSDEEELEKQLCQSFMEDLSLETKAVDDDGNDPEITSGSRVIPLHEIICCCLDRPKLLSRLSALLDEVGLHIWEGHLYCTVDGFCLALFSVCGWKTEETSGLIDKINEALALKNQSNSTSSSTSEKWLDLQQKLDLKLTGANCNEGEMPHLDLLRN